MSVINKIQINGTTYDIEDANLKLDVEALQEEVEVATDADIDAAIYS